jgi:hypothetical protein
MENKYEIPISLNVETAPDRNNKSFTFATVKQAEVKP